MEYSDGMTTLMVITSIHLTFLISRRKLGPQPYSFSQTMIRFSYTVVASIYSHYIPSHLLTARVNDQSWAAANISWTPKISYAVVWCW